MSIEQMRAALKKLYSKAWHDKVDKMHDRQVAATYQRLMNAGKL